MPFIDESPAEQPTVSIPQSLRQQLKQFRQYVWKTKVLEALSLAGLGLGLGFITLFAIDRWIDTSVPVRLAISTVVLGVWMVVPWAIHRWVWKHRRFDQLAKLVRRRAPSLGDQLLGVVELAENRTEQHRSPALCAAAIRQVAEQTATRNLLDMAPRSRHQGWGRWALFVFGFIAVMMLLVPQPAMNALARLLLPWRSIDRYTFTQLESLPPRMVVPHGESFSLDAKLRETTRWSPREGTASLDPLPSIASKRVDSTYHFDLPSLNRESSLRLKIGDYIHRMAIEPKPRPELTRFQALVMLPEYLQRPQAMEHDLRGGTLNMVTGSTIKIVGRANRDLEEAQLYALSMANSSGEAGASPPEEKSGEVRAAPEPIGVVTRGGEIRSDAILVKEGPTKLSLDWKDHDGLTARSPLQISVHGANDSPPMVAVDELPRQAIVLNSEQINFGILATDDFGVQQLGMEWSIVPESEGEQEERPSQSKVLAAGDPLQTNVTAQGAFRPIDLGIESDIIDVRIWATDYYPERPRGYSEVHRLYVMRQDEHAVWMTDQLNKWHRQALDVRDRELQLHQMNRELRSLTSAELATPEGRRRLEEQAAAEIANERRLKGLTSIGKELLRQAARNSEMGVGHLDRWAETLSLLDDISGKRMPKVSDLLNQASRDVAAKSQAKKGEESDAGPSVGNIRHLAQGADGDPDDQKPESDAKSDKDKEQAMPSIVDIESSSQPADKLGKTDPAKPDEPMEASGATLTLPSTLVVGPPKKETTDKPAESAASEKVDAAVTEQAELLAEFEKIADELNDVLSELEGSTLVKRLKAASREQTQVAQEIHQHLEKILDTTYSTSSMLRSEKYLSGAASMETKGSEKISNIIDDLEAFYERKRLVKYQNILQEMKDSQVVGALRQIGEEIHKQHGMSIAQAEYWSDTFDRWAEDLVDPAADGSCPGSQSAGSLPPSVILEVLQILEGEVNIREQTRVAEQARPAIDESEHRTEADRIASLQDGLTGRTHQVLERIQGLPQADEHFAQELEMLGEAERLMGEAARLLRKPSTGKDALAVETEIIELLLESKRIQPKSQGGGSGTAPGGGGKGETSDSALALLGPGMNLLGKNDEREVSQATGQTGREFPQEFRNGLNEYFNQLEKSIDSAAVKP